MPKRGSTDIDHVPEEPPPKRTPKQPPKPHPPPGFSKKLTIHNAPMYGRPQLPVNMVPTGPYSIFKLFFTDGMLDELATHTNQYAKLYPPPPSPHARGWHPTTPKELLAYIAVIIYMGAYGVEDVTTFWDTKPENGRHSAIYDHISLCRWQQIDRFFHISKPTRAKESVFVKTEPLYGHLRGKFQEYYQPGTNLSVDEAIQRFTGRSADIVNIPSKPTSEGYKIWVLASAGYVVDWLWHSKGVTNVLRPRWSLC